MGIRNIYFRMRSKAAKGETSEQPAGGKKPKKKKKKILEFG